MLNEEYESKEFDFPLRRLETGNYYLRIILRYAEISKSQFEKTCADLKIKLELLEAKNDQEIVRHLQRIMGEWMTFHRSVAHTQSARKMFPFEMDLGKATASLQKEAPKPLDPLLVYRDEDDDDEDDEDANVTNECGGDGSNKTNHDSVQHPNAKPKIVERYSDALTALDGSMMHSTDVVPSKEEQEKFRRLQMTSAESNRSTEQTSNFFDISLENNEPQIEVEKDLWSFE